MCVRLSAWFLILFVNIETRQNLKFCRGLTRVFTVFRHRNDTLQTIYANPRKSGECNCNEVSSVLFIHLKIHISYVLFQATTFFWFLSEHVRLHGRDKCCARREERRYATYSRTGYRSYVYTIFHRRKSQIFKDDPVTMYVTII